MKIVVVSDTHGDYNFIENIVTKHKDCDMFLHAGDSCLREYELEPFISVRGNCDFDIKHISRILNINGYKIFIFHGDKYYLHREVLYTLCNDNECDIIIHGHTHIANYEKYKDVHIICPGSLIDPRGGFPSYAIIEIDDDVKVEIMKYEY